MELMDINDPNTVLTLTADTSDSVAIPAGLNYISIFIPLTDTNLGPTFVKTTELEAATADNGDTAIPHGVPVSFKRNSQHTFLAAYNETETPTLYIKNGGGA